MRRQISGTKRPEATNPLDDFPWKNDRKAGGGRTVTSVAAEFGINKSVISRAWKAFQTTGTAVRKVGGSRPRTTTAGGWPIYPPAGEKRQTAVSKRHCSATLYSNGATSVVVCVWSNAFTKGPIRPPS
ncbi:uncharacterized protein TNCV_3335971 [Trichonephila clavipes]|nr:uncharacterized protein TNCV_3335971 [Trichonephila clavipes]